MRIRGCVASLLILLLPVIVAGCSKSEPPKPAATPPAVSGVTEGKALFEQKCGVCHGLDRATARKDSKEQWIRVVEEMKAKKADWITDAEAAKIVEFLASEHGKK